MVHNALQSTPLTPLLQIVSAGIKMEDAAAARWWNDNREELKKLTKWEDFATRVRVRLIPERWKLEALRRFYAVEQGVRLFSDFLQELQSMRNALGTAGTFAIKDGIFKNHLLFRARETLTLRIMAIPNFAFDTIAVDSLVSLMSATADSMVAESGFSSLSSPSLVPPMPRLVIPSVSSLRSIPMTPSVPVSYTLPELSYAERQNLKAAGGCHHGRRMPSSPDWITHMARNCPGNPSTGIPPLQSNPSVTVAAVGMSSCVLEGSNTDDSDGGCGDQHRPGR